MITLARAHNSRPHFGCTSAICRLQVTRPDVTGRLACARRQVLAIGERAEGPIFLAADGWTGLPERGGGGVGACRAPIHLHRGICSSALAMHCSRCSSACLGYLWAGDTQVVWRLDRSLRHPAETVNALADRGLAFASLHEGIVHQHRPPVHPARARQDTHDQVLRCARTDADIAPTSSFPAHPQPSLILRAPLPRMRSVRFPYDPRQHPIPAASAPPEGYLAWLHTRRHRALAWSGRPRSRPARGRSPAVSSQPALRS